jgi:hypothetical protein
VEDVSNEGEFPCINVTDEMGSATDVPEQLSITHGRDAGVDEGYAGAGVLAYSDGQIEELVNNSHAHKVYKITCSQAVGH